MKSIDLVAPCGLYCRDCVLYKDNISDDLKDAMSNKYEVPLDEVPCRGCRTEKPAGDAELKRASTSTLLRAIAPPWTAPAKRA